MTTNTPIDEYNFWKRFIENKQKSRKPVDSKLFELLALAELKMQRYVSQLDIAEFNNVKH